MTIIQALRRLWQKNHEFEAILGYKARPYLNPHLPKERTLNEYSIWSLEKQL
jgi:hypothetical protein